MQMNTKVFEALGDNTRLGIVQFLLAKEKGTCCDIAARIKKDVSTTFRHIDILRGAGIIKTKKNGKFLECGIADKKNLTKLLEVAKCIR